MTAQPNPAAVDYPELAALAIHAGTSRSLVDIEAARALIELDKWRQADAAEQAIYDIETETD